MGKDLKNFFKKWNLVISKPENRKLWSETAIKIEFDFKRRRKNFFIADNKLQADQIKRKIEANFYKSLFIWKSNTSKSQNSHNFSSNELETTTLSYSGIQLDLSLVSFGLKCSVN